jgi:hypothetical protein
MFKIVLYNTGNLTIQRTYFFTPRRKLYYPRTLLLWLKTPRCRSVRTCRIRPPIQGRVLRGRVDAHEERVNRPVDRRIWRVVDEHAALQQIEPHAQPPPKQMKSSGVQSVINGEDRNVNNVYNTDPMLITCDNKTDIFISKSTKDKIWNLEYTDLSLPVRHNFNCQSVIIIPITCRW